jgi:hypothetical protein
LRVPITMPANPHPCTSILSIMGPYPPRHTIPLPTENQIFPMSIRARLLPLCLLAPPVANADGERLRAECE